MALRISDEENQKLNPGQTHSDRQFNGLKNAEENGNSQDKPEGNNSSDTNNIDTVKNAEDNPNSDWKNNVSGEKPDTKKTGGRFSFIKKKGPLTTIIITVLGGGIGIGGLLSPGLLIVNLKEVMVNKFNAQLTSMDIRTTKILTKKVTGGACGIIKISCKYSSMSEKQISKFAKAGITVKSTRVNLLGKAIPDEFEFDGKTIKSTEFSKAINENPKFRTALKKAYNSKFAGFADTIFSKLIAKWRMSTNAAKISGDTDEEKLKSIQEQTKSGDLSGQAKANGIIDENTQKVDENGKPMVDPETNKPITYSADEVASAKALSNVANEIGDGAADVAAKATKVGGAALDSATSVLKVTGIADNACTVYGMVQALGYAAKTVRAIQLARYAMIFLNVADQIKAGDAKPEDVAYLGGIITTEIAATATSMKIRSGTDSFGYKFAAYGERGKMSTIASQFLAGGGLTGDLINITSSINGILGGTPRVTCGFLKNPFIGFGSAIVGIAAMTTPIGWGKLGVQLASSLAMSAATVTIPQMLKDIVAGVLVDKTTIGEASVDTVTSGSSGLMGLTAAGGGNAPLTVTQAVKYNDLTQDVLAQYAEEDKLAYSPFDTSNSNTFMGKIVASLVPYVSKMSSISGVLSSIASLSTKSLASLISQNTYATDPSDYTMCQDYDYKDMNLATDPYCNVTYGIPVEYLNEDPAAISDALVAEGQIDSETGAITGTEYQTFLNNCINRSTPLGDSGDSFKESKTGKNCLIDSTNKNYYLYYIDQRVEKGMDGEDSILEANSSLPDYGTISFYNGSNSTVNNLANSSESDVNNKTTIVNNAEKTKTIGYQLINLKSLLNIPIFGYYDTNRYSL